MATKWKSRIFMSVWALLFSFGFSGILAFFIHGSDYIQRDYFHTSQFQTELDQYAGYLSLELYNLSLEEAKKTITVSDAEINEHRYRYGNLTEQIANIKSQYEDQIQGAKDTDNQEALKAFIAERDTKIKDITNNFKSDDYVRAKVIKEKEEALEDYFKKREAYRTEYKKYEGAFIYYFKNTETNKVYTNLSNEQTPQETINKDTLFKTNMVIGRNYAINYVPTDSEQLIDSLIPATAGTFEGKIAIPKTLSSDHSFIMEYKNYQQKQLFLLIYSIAGLVALIGSLIVANKSKTIPVVLGTWQPFYNKLPIDAKAILFILSITGFVTAIYVVSDQALYILDNPYDGIEMLVGLIISSFAWGYTFVQWKYLKMEVNDWSKLKQDWNKGLSIRAGRRIKITFNKTVQNFREAFLNQAIGTQLFILLAIVFGLGLASITVVIHPIFIILYFLLLVCIGIPIVMLLVNKIGYFNRILEVTKEIAAGNLGNNLEVTGKTALSMLAGYINELKQGVKTSQNEQAKSERLKTELITNVSHDLRTPLTSIITYTDLLKAENVSKENKAAYLEIIDRKSKRLKVLIDDLFEVSKMASGNMELTKQTVDLVQLLQQALAEYDDTIKESNLQLRVTNTEKTIYAHVDGQKLWRVFDNLIGNILKYSLEHSRVYITLSKVNNQAHILFKNVSKYELSDNIDELFERFKRGDQSRHTDGSGLGLAIAKSIVDLHEGKLDIDTDGDLFKVSIYLNLEE